MLAQYLAIHGFSRVKKWTKTLNKIGVTELESLCAKILEEDDGEEQLMALCEKEDDKTKMDKLGNNLEQKVLTNSYVTNTVIAIKVRLLNARQNIVVASICL